jgi:hypothetical protein
MKKLLLFIVCILSFNTPAEILSVNEDLFARQAEDNAGKSGKEIIKESIENYKNFVDMDVNELAVQSLSIIDSNKPTTITEEQGQGVIDAAESNPVVALAMIDKKYDKEEKGIGFCFGRAMFTNLFLAQSGFNRANIKKAFIMGSMSNGAWGWHVTTIVQSKNFLGKETWLALDPVAGQVMEVSAWYKYWSKSSDDGKLRLYITEAGKFGPSGNSRYDEDAITDDFYNKYFIDMMKWFNKNEVDLFEKAAR